MDFPQESINLAREIVSKYKKRGRSKRALATSIYYKDFYELGYGFNESIKTGNCGRYFHEIIKESDCFTMAGVLYLLARESDLKPKLYKAFGLKDVREGKSPKHNGYNDHAFITVEPRKNEIVTIDPFMQIFAKTVFQPEKNRIKLYELRRDAHIYRSYAYLEEISQDDYIRETEQRRKPEGGRIVLTGTQRIEYRGLGTHITYLPETNELRNSIIFRMLDFGPETYKKDFIIDLKTKVDKNGSFDFNKGNLNFSYASKAGWTEHEGKTVSMEYPVENAVKLWNLWDKLIRKKGRKTLPNRMNILKLNELLQNTGLNDNFELEKNSLADNLVKQQGLESIIYEIQETANIQAEKYIKKCEQDGISYRLLLQDSQIKKIKDKAKTKENFWGIVFPKKEHINLLQDNQKLLAKSYVFLFRKMISKSKVNAGLKKGTLFHERRKIDLALSRMSEKLSYFEEMCSIRSSRSTRDQFYIMADRYLLQKQFNIYEMSIKELKKGLTKSDLLRESRNLLFNNLLNSYNNRRALFLKKFKKGLEKILKIE